jgi:hypothetical protein
MLNYGLDVHKRYTTYCVMDDEGQVLEEGRCPNEGIPLCTSSAKFGLFGLLPNGHFGRSPAPC